MSHHHHTLPSCSTTQHQEKSHCPSWAVPPATANAPNTTTSSLPSSLESLRKPTTTSGATNFLVATAVGRPNSSCGSLEDFEISPRTFSHSAFPSWRHSLLPSSSGGGGDPSAQQPASPNVGSIGGSVSQRRVSSAGNTAAAARFESPTTTTQHNGGRGGGLLQPATPRTSAAAAATDAKRMRCGGGGCASSAPPSPGLFDMEEPGSEDVPDDRRVPFHPLFPHPISGGPKAASSSSPQNTSGRLLFDME